MNGVEYLLDSNLIIGVLKGYPPALALLAEHNAQLNNCGYSAVTRIEILSYPKGTRHEYEIAAKFLSDLQYFSFNKAIEEETIFLRRQTNLKLPDAMILATSQFYGLPLLTLDKKLQGLDFNIDAACRG